LAVQLKGSPDGIRVICDPFVPEEHLLEELSIQLHKGQKFLEGARLQVELGQRPMTAELVEKILDLIGSYPSLTLGSIGAGTPPKPPRRKPSLPQTHAAAKIFRRTVRSGQEIVHSGDLVILGDVNHGGTVRAAGDLIVLGTLRGTAQAGFAEDDSRFIYAHVFQPTQLRLGSHIAVDPGHGVEPIGPEIARVVHEQIVVEPFTGRIGQRSGRRSRKAMA